ncbi:Phosphotransferase enzyme family protein [Cognatiyoonia koreensis]|uniref:Phosphotransferase enzyme family protein n=1 Tax=Cognatiyoonia koreensis TaxID=364200 RepID=A0A1I0RCA0_9RHOB|nr:aminoglycoside phosphotransferase family protein [Cognatiyoonia koreensis]SEW38481.1 Phosphotransferase enzyme family protein [Cognatiyoonia koreensis]
MIPQRLLRQFHVDLVAARKMVDAFMAACGLTGEPEFTCIYQSTDFKDRHVYKVIIADAAYALKFDGRGAQTRRLADEFDVLKRLHARFAAHKGLGVPQPIYADPDGAFFVTKFLDLKTATDVVRDTDNDAEVARLYRRTADWLGTFHGFGEVTKAAFWPNWMVESLAEAVADGPQASPVDYQPMIAVTRLNAMQLAHKKCTKAQCHGDFHGRNIMIGGDELYAFDVTEVTEKLAVYDIVDFLKDDIYREAMPEQIDASGVIRANREEFIANYAYTIDPQILEFCLRTRLLIDWVSITREMHAKSAFQRRKFDLLQLRLQIAFA